MKTFSVYVLSNKSKTLYIGVTNDLLRRLYEHRQKLIPGFTRKYNLTKLVYFEQTENVTSAIEREKQLKGWIRQKKIELIEKSNPTWIDLSQDWNLYS